MGVEVLKELGKLTQLRKLGIHKLRSEDGRVVFGGIEKISNLKSFVLTTIYEDDDNFDSEWLSSLPQSLSFFS